MLIEKEQGRFTKTNANYQKVKVIMVPDVFPFFHFFSVKKGERRNKIYRTRIGKVLFTWFGSLGSNTRPNTFCFKVSPSVCMSFRSLIGSAMSTNTKQ